MRERHDGDRLLLLRRQNGWGQDVIAKACNVSRQTVSNWENGRHPIPQVIWSLLAAGAIAGTPEQLERRKESAKARKAELDYWRRAYRTHFTQFGGHNEAIGVWQRPDAIHHGVHVMEYLAKPENADILAALEETRKDLENGKGN